MNRKSCPACGKVPPDIRKGFFVCSCGTMIREKFTSSQKDDGMPEGWEQEREVIKKRSYRLAKNRLDTLVEHIEPPANILEIGCGTGEFTDLAQQEGYSVTALDAMNEAVNYINNSIPQVDAQHTKFESYESNKRFDAIVAFHVFEHLPDPDQAITKMKSHLKEQGIIYLITPNSESNTRTGPRQFMGGVLSNDHKILYSEEGIKSLFQAHNLDVIWSITKMDAAEPLLTLKNWIAWKFGLLSIDGDTNSKIGDNGRARQINLLYQRVLFGFEPVLHYLLSPVRYYLEKTGEAPALHIIGKFNG